tara:strand:- start:7163 stop:7372 length:210 start_codon:yes stop_codon:yes gene_type:complete
MFLKLQNGNTFNFFDQGCELQVTSNNGFTGYKEQWFIIYLEQGETFKEEVKRIAAMLSDERNSKIYFLN